MKKILLLMLCIVLLVGTVSAIDWDDIKPYNESTKTYTLKNFFGLDVPIFGGTIAELELKTPQKVELGLGYLKVAEIEIRNGKYDYEEIINGIELYNINQGMKEVVRSIDYKYKTIIQIPNYEIVCEDVVNENKTISNICNQVEKGTKDKIVWEDFEKNSLLKEEIITLGLFTETKEGDRIEWVLNVYGNERLTAWAKWTASLTVGLNSYYMEDEGSVNTGTVIDSYINNFHGINENVANVTGKLIYAYNFTGSSEHISIDNNSALNQVVGAFSMWINPQTLAGGKIMLASGDTVGGAYFFVALSTNGQGTIEIGSNPSISSMRTTGSSVIVNQFTHIVVTTDGTETYFFMNGTVQPVTLLSGSAGKWFGNNTPQGQDTFSIGILDRGADYAPFTGVIDEVAIYGRNLTGADVTQLYNAGAGISFIPPSNLNVTLNNPSVDQNFFNRTIDFNCSASDDVSLTNVSLVINGTIEQTNTSGINNSNYLFTETITTGNGLYNWTCRAYDNENSTTIPTARNFTISNNLAITLLVPINAFNTTNPSIIFNGTASDDTAVINVSLFLNGVLNETNSSGLNNTNYSFTKNLAEGNGNWTMQVCDFFGCVSASTRNFTVDTTFPVVNITYPLNTTYLDGYVTNNTRTMDLNWTTTDANLDSCWYSTNHGITNTSITCGDNKTFTLDYSVYNFTVYANDTLGHNSSSNVTATWNYKILENSYIYDNDTYETSLEEFSINVSSDGSEIITANLIYNGTLYSALKVGDNNLMEFNRTISLSQVGINISFYWSFIYGSEVLNSSTFNQTVTALSLSGCPSGTTTLNFTTYNEEDLSAVAPYDFFGTFWYWLGDGSAYNSVSISNQSVNYASLCLGLNSTYYSNATIQYEKDGFVKRSYYLVNETLTNVTQNISLFLLNTSISTSFIIEVEDEVQLPISNVYVYIQRYYPGTDEFETVEMALTDNIGSTIGHFEAETEDYRLIFEKYQVIIYQSGTQKIFCRETPCTLTFQTIAGAGISWADIGLIDKFDWTLDYDEVTEVWTLIYTDTSGSIGYGRLYVYYEDPIEGKMTICNKTSTQLSDTIICDVTGYNGTIYAAAYLSRSPEILVYLKSIVISALKAIFGLEGLFLSMFILLSLAMAGLWNPAVGIILVVVGMIILNVMGLAAFGATAIWSIIFIALIILWELKT